MARRRLLLCESVAQETRMRGMRGDRTVASLDLRGAILRLDMPPVRPWPTAQRRAIVDKLHGF